MIRLFRNIRKQLAAENNIAKYLRYAIGEVILVVIGILIALQINNWNEDRKDILREKKMLLDIRNDINKNIANLEEGVIYTTVGKQCNLNVLNFIDEQREFDDSMINDFTEFSRYWDPDFTEASFENLKSLGVNLVRDDSLRNRIIELFEIDMDILDVSNLNSHNNYMTSVANPVFSKYFYYNWKSMETIFEQIPFNYDLMIADRQFYSVCSRILLDQEIALRQSEAFIAKSKTLNQDIEDRIALLD